MKKTALIISLLLSFSSYTKADEAPPRAQATTTNNVMATNTTSTIRISTRPEILGLWGMEIPENKKCIEYYNFRGSNEVVVNSAKERSVGLFDYQPSPDNTLEKPPALIMQIRYENNETDCSGRKEDQTGDVSQYYVKWINKNTMSFCASDKGDQCFATLRKVLP